MKGYRGNTFKKLGLGLIQLSLLASTIAIGVNSTAFGKTLSCQKNNTSNNSFNELKLDSPSLELNHSSVLLLKVYKELEVVELYGFCSISLKGHLSLFSGVSPPTV